MIEALFKASGEKKFTICCDGAFSFCSSCLQTTCYYAEWKTGPPFIEKMLMTITSMNILLSGLKHAALFHFIRIEYFCY